jgi:hypothetical protein
VIAGSTLADTFDCTFLEALILGAGEIFRLFREKLSRAACLSHWTSFEQNAHARPGQDQLGALVHFSRSPAILKSIRGS